MLAFIEKIGLAMKVVLMLLFVTTYALNAHGGCFTIKGEILNLHETTYVDFSYVKIQNGLWVEERVDSILVNNGIFSVTGDVEELMAATIKYDNHKYRIYVEPCEMSVLIDANTPYFLKQTGTSVDKETENVRRYLRKNDSILYAKYEDYITHPFELRDGKDRFLYYLEVCDERQELLIQYFEANPHTPIGSEII